MGRSNYIKKCIAYSSFFVGSSMIDYSTKERILSAANVMMNEAWKIEYRSYKEPHKQLQIQAFWDDIHTDLVSQGEVYDMEARFGEDVNPPGEEGNVFVWVQPNASVARHTFRLSIKGNERTDETSPSEG